MVRSSKTAFLLTASALSAEALGPFLCAARLLPADRVSLIVVHKRPSHLVLMEMQTSALQSGLILVPLFCCKSFMRAAVLVPCLQAQCVSVILGLCVWGAGPPASWDKGQSCLDLSGKGS